MRPKKRAKIVRRCVGCRASIDHKHKNARFCCQPCKDRYHNTVNPRGYGLNRYDDLDGEPEDLSWDAHKGY